MKKLPIICLIDTSIYNSFEKLHATNIALELFHNLVSRDDYLKESCEIFFYTFSKDLTLKGKWNLTSKLNNFQVEEKELSGLNLLGNALYKLNSLNKFKGNFYKPNLFIFSAHVPADTLVFDYYCKEKNEFSSICIFSSGGDVLGNKYEYMKLTDNVLNVEYLNEALLSMCLKFEE